MTACPNCAFENADAAKYCAECGQKLGGVTAPAREVRRTVTVLFADVAGSTAMGEQLDPESLRGVMGRYFAAIRGIVEHHGGIVEKFIGDAVMAVFGIPNLHEDDALRAVRAAAEIRDRLAQLDEELQHSRGLSVVFRTGVNTGVVVAGDPSAGETFVTGDAVNTAARLEQAAKPGEILLGQGTYRLVRDAIVAEPIEPIYAKGKAEPVPAYRLVSVTAFAPGRARGLDAPLVGRDREIHVLTDAFHRAVADRASQLVTVLGAAGVGKSRLVQEFLERVGGEATCLTGRCLSYGEGLTYWPLADALRTHIGVDDDHPAESWRAGLLALVAGQPQEETVVAQVAGLIGVGEAAEGTDAFWAVRRLLEGMARRRPLVFVIDDLHWATPTFLDLVEHVADWSRDVPILLVCLARPELLDLRPGWGGGKMNATSFLLGPLDAASVDQLLAHLVGSTEVAPERQRRIAAAAEGNPLFVEELVAMLAERDAMDISELPVPPTIEALMAARLDQLPSAERGVLERGSVIGMQIGAAEVARLGDESGSVAVRPALMAMVRRDLLRPDAEASLPLGADDEGFRFRHQLIRDGAYAALSKAERSRLHERYAGLLEELPAEQLRQLDEVAGYHLEQAALLRASLGGTTGGSDLATRAAHHLGAAGMRAYERADPPAAANLLARASGLLPPGDLQRIGLLPTLSLALISLGRFDEALATAEETIEGTADGSNPAARVVALLARAAQALARSTPVAETRPDLDEALAIAEAGDDLALVARVQASFAAMAWIPGQLREARRTLEAAIETAQRARARGPEVDARSDLAFVTWAGINSGADIQRVLGEQLAFAREHGRRDMEGLLLKFQAVEAARGDRFPEARLLMADCRAILEDLGLAVQVESAALERGYLEFLADEPAAREVELREGYDRLSAMGERGFLSAIAADLADAVLNLGRTEEAEALCAAAEVATAEDDVISLVRAKLVRGRLAAAKGRMREAIAAAADATTMSDQGEYYDIRTGSRLVLAQLLLDAGRGDEARVPAHELLDLARQRGDVVFEGMATALLERADPSSRAPS